MEVADVVVHLLPVYFWDVSAVLSFHVFGIHTVFCNVTVPETNYALLGMAGVMSGVFHAPLTGVFLIAELTGGYDLFIPLMIVSVASYLTINAFERHSIYAMRLARKGELLTHHKDQSVLTLMTLDAIIDKRTADVASANVSGADCAGYINQ